MKTFKKVLASALAAAMVVTAFPVTNAEAATKAKLSATKATIYVGQSKTIKVTLPAGAKISSVKTSKKAVATVKKSGKKVVVKAVKAGKATVTVKVTPKKGKAKSLKATITVKNPTITMKGDAELLIGATTSCKATVKPSTKVAYTSSDDAIATVDANGSVKGVKAGTVTITATAKVGTKTVKATKDIVVKNGITELKATTPKKLTVKFAGEVTLTKDNFTVTGENNAKVAVKSVAFDATKTIATVELYSALTTGKKYTVTVKNGADTYTADVDFVRGEVAKIEAADQNVLAGSAQPIKYTVYDENGLDVTDDTTVAFDSNVAITGGKINLQNGVMAIVTVVYTNPKTGAQVKSNTFKVTGANSVAATIDAIHVADPSKAVSDAKKWPATVNTTIAKGTTGYVMQVLYTDNFGTKKLAPNTCDITSLDPNVLIVNKQNDTIKTVSEGTAQIKVTKDGKEAYFTVTVTPALKAASLKTDDSSVLKASKTNPTVNKATVKVNVLDQNGNKFNAGQSVTYKLLSGKNVTVDGTAFAENATKTVPAGQGIVVNATTAGTAIFQVSATGLNSIIVNVTIYETDDVVTGYNLTGVKATMNINDKYDTTIAAADKTNTTTVSLKAVNKDGFVVADGSGAGSVGDDATSGAVITLKKGNETKATGTSITIDAEVLGEGEYTLIATKGGSTYSTATFTVKDTGVKPAVTFKADTFKTSDTLASMLDIGDNFLLDGIYFTSTDESVIVSAPTTGTIVSGNVTFAAGAPATANGQIANVVVQVHKSIGGQTRTYKIAVTNYNYITITH